MIAIQSSSSALPPTSSHYQPQASSSRPRPNRPNSPTLPPTLHRSPSSSSSSSHLLSLLHPERSPNSHAAPIPRRLQTSPLILCEASPFHKRSLSSSSSSSNSPGSSPSPTSRMASLPEVGEEEEKTGAGGALKCNGRSPEEMKRVCEGLLFPREDGARKFD